MSLKSILCLWVLAFLVSLSVADDVDDSIIDLQDPDPQIRGNAAAWLESNGDQRAVDPLIEALKDESEYVRMEAAHALGRIGDTRAVDPLIEALKDEIGNVRSSASEALGAIGDQKAVEPLIEVIEDEGVEVLDIGGFTVGTSATQALGKIIGATGQWESFTPDRTAFAAQPGGVFPLRGNPVEAGSYLFMIGPAGDGGLSLPPESWETYTPTELVGGHKYKLSICSGTAGYHLDFEKDQSDLLPYSDPGAGFASVYVGSNPICKGRDMWYVIYLWKIKKGASAPAIADDVDRWIQDLNATSPSVREAAAEKLGDLGNTRAVGPLIKALSDTDSGVRGWAAYALGELNDTRAVDPLILALNDTAPNVRGYAALSLGQLGDTRAVGPLIHTLSATDSDDRASAVQALGDLKDPRAVDPLILSLKDENSDVRWCAAEALGKLSDTRAVGPLIQALKDEDYMVRGRAAEALGNLRDTRAVEPLIPALKDEYEYVQSVAKDSLTKLGWQQGRAQSLGSSPIGAHVDEGL